MDSVGNINIIIQLMLEEILEQQKITDEALKKDPNAIMSINVPIQSQQQAVSIIRKSNTAVTAMKEKQLNLLMGKTYYDQKIKNKLTPFKFIDNQKTINQYTFNKQELEKYSIYPILAQIILEHFQNLLQIETQINPVTKKMIEILPGLTVVEFVTKLIQRQNLCLQFNLLDIIMRGQTKMEDRKRLWRPLFEFVYQKLKKLHFLIDFQAAKDLIFNDRLLEPMTEDDIVKKQSKTIQNVLGEANSQPNRQYQLRVQQYMITQAIKRRELVKVDHPFFFAVIKQMTDYEKMVVDSLNSQQKIVSKARDDNRKRIITAEQSSQSDIQEITQKKSEKGQEQISAKPEKRNRTKIAIQLIDKGAKKK